MSESTIKNPATDKADWLRRCAAYFMSRADAPQDQADYLAAECWKNCVDDIGDEAGCLREWEPEDAALEELSCWSE
jgi:hypothetical protein